MAIPAKVPISAGFRSTTNCTRFSNYAYPISVSRRFLGPSRRRRWCRKLIRASSSSSEKEAVHNFSYGELCRGEFWEHPEFVEVIGIGSKKDVVLDFCMESTLKASAPLRFWNIIKKEANKVQLQQRLLEKDVVLPVAEAVPSIQSSPKAIILVACCGYGVDHIAAIDVVKKVRSGNGYAVAIVLKPFSFEGQKRRNEVKYLIEELHKHTNLCLDIDTDLLLKEDFLTLDEAVKTANYAVSLAVNSISASQQRYIVLDDNVLREIELSKLIKTLDCNTEAKIGFGSGYNIKSSVFQAVYECPFIAGGIKDSTTAICILATSVEMTEKELLAFMRTLRRSAGYTNEIIISNICEPSLEPNLLMTTIIAIESSGQQATEKGNIFSKFVQKIPFVFNLMRGQDDPLGGNEGGASTLDSDQPAVIDGSGESNMQKMVPINGKGEDPDLPNNEFLTAQSSKFEVTSSAGEPPVMDRDLLFSRNLGPGYAIAKEWVKESAAVSGPVPVPNHLSNFNLPVGVKPLEKSKDSLNILKNRSAKILKVKEDLTTETVVKDDTRPWSTLTEAGFDAVKSFYNSASNIVTGPQPEPPEKQGGLSMRAASMLESERDVPKMWNPIVEMQYRGGVYRGRCQGGLPEGKGRLTLPDGNAYDGLWHNGKKAGSGTFYFTNGDLFQGSWRDDLMHGKGWFYFHTGDRWFADFWKGKANGEGRFYSKSGDVFFGHFQDGLRHGEFICINVEGTRWKEVWDQGVLLSRELAESDSDVE